MAKVISNKNQKPTTTKPVVSQKENEEDKTAAVFEISGSVTRNDNEESDIEFLGGIEVKEPGEYWLNGFMKKDAEGNVYLELQTKLKQAKAPNVILDDRGVLFVNNRKRRKGHADYTGNISFSTSGEFEIHGEMKTGSGTKYMELTIPDTSESAISEDEKFF